MKTVIDFINEAKHNFLIKGHTKKQKEENIMYYADEFVKAGIVSTVGFDSLGVFAFFNDEVKKANKNMLVWPDRIRDKSDKTTNEEFIEEIKTFDKICCYVCIKDNKLNKYLVDNFDEITSYKDNTNFIIITTTNIITTFSILNKILKYHEEHK